MEFVNVNLVVCIVTTGL